MDCLGRNRELFAFYDYLAAHRVRLRTTNAIGSTFSTIRLRTKRAKGCLSRDGMLHMIFKLGECAQQNWRRQRGFNYLAKVVQGITFKDGEKVPAVDQNAA